MRSVPTRSPPQDYYTQTADLWSVGCILAELLTGKILFQGHNCSHFCLSCIADCSAVMKQITLIMQLIGRPSAEYVASLKSEPVCYIASLDQSSSINRCATTSMLNPTIPSATFLSFFQTSIRSASHAVSVAMLIRRSRGSAREAACV